MISLGVALSAGRARAEMPQCKFTTTQSFFSNWQDPDLLNSDVLSVGLSEAQKGHWDNEIEAEQYALASTGDTPNLDFVAAMNLANAYWHEGKFPDAISAANMALQTHVDDSLAYEQRAVMYFNNNNMAEAVSDATKAIAIDPCMRQAYETRADADRRMHLMAQAAADEANVLAIDTDYIEQKPADAGLYVTRGNDEEFQDQHDQAIADFSKAIALNPKDEAAFIDRGDAYGDEGRYVDDVSDQTEAVTLNPKDAIAWNDLCWGLAVTGDLPDAMSSCNEALTLAPTDIDPWDTRGYVDLKMKNYTQAVVDYGAVLEIDPEYASSLYGRGLAERGLGEISASTADIAKAENNDPDIAEEYSK